MKWEHRTSELWMLARRDVLTASEIVDLIPEMKRVATGKEPADIPAGFAAMWAKKMTPTEPEVYSVNDAARGHIMEPYAIAAYNRQHHMARTLRFHHWDDALITANGIGFSPDALPIPQPPGVVFTRDDLAPMLPASAMEVKAYAPARHMKAYLTDKDKLTERYQLAVAMAVLDEIETGILLFFCPGHPIEMFERIYTREELIYEIGMVDDIKETYWQTVRKLEKLPRQMTADITEAEVYEEYLKAKDDVMRL